MTGSYLNNHARAMDERLTLPAMDSIRVPPMLKVLEKQGDGSFLLTENRVESDRYGVFETKWKYAIHEGIAIPVVYDYRQTDANGHLVTAKKVQLTDVTVNGPLDDQLFQLSSLEARDLDWFDDKTTNQKRIFWSGELFTAGELGNGILPR